MRLHEPSGYRGRIAPSPTGYLHLGHTMTFWTARERAREGVLVLRVEDLDTARCKDDFRAALEEDLRWFGIDWQEGPDSGGPCGPYLQSQRDYLPAWRRLRDAGLIYPCNCSRRDVSAALAAPHEEGDEPLYPGTCRNRVEEGRAMEGPGGVNWRLRVPDGERISFLDGRAGECEATCGAEFGDFLVWRKDGVPSYQLAVVADDAAMGITEVVRGGDLLRSTFRQILLYRALGLTQPAWYHCPLIRDGEGKRLAKRDAALSLRELRRAGMDPGELRERLAAGGGYTAT